MLTDKASASVDSGRIKEGSAGSGFHERPRRARYFGGAIALGVSLGCGHAPRARETRLGAVSGKVGLLLRVLSTNTSTIPLDPYYCNHHYFYQTQVYLGSDLWVGVSLSD